MSFININDKATDFGASIDLNLNGNNIGVSEEGAYTVDSQEFQLYDISTGSLKASRNRALLWFASKQGDFVREPSKGGALYSLLGNLCSSTDLRIWEQSILQKFNEEFNNDLTLLSLKLSVINGYRGIEINAYFRDNLTGKTDNISGSLSN